MNKDMGAIPGSKASPGAAKASPPIGYDPGRGECPYDPRTQLAEHQAWFKGWQTGADDINRIWNRAFPERQSA
jgi:hypothetical protein